MFFHGITYEHLLYQYPILSPRLTILRQNNKQKMDRMHLIEKFGFEPVHFLESSRYYSKAKCIESCFLFGNVIFVYQTLPLPMLQLSFHEIGVPVIDVRKADYVITNNKKLIHHLMNLLENKPIIFTNKFPQSQ